MPYSEADLLPISALQHLLFCERQCALIHIEGLWAENWRTVEGSHLHAKAHEGPDETREGVRVVRGLMLQSRRLGLVGKADVVEFHLRDSTAASPATFRLLRDAVRSGAVRQQQPGSVAGGSQQERTQDALADWVILPVEYKRGRPKRNDCDRVQLCAQAMCLEEMLGAQVNCGALFYGQRRRRTEVAFDESLRRRTSDAAAQLHALIRAGITPRVQREPKCDSCSLLSLCLPQATGPRRSAVRFVDRQFSAALRSSGPTTEFMENE